MGGQSILKIGWLGKGDNCETIFSPAGGIKVKYLRLRKFGYLQVRVIYFCRVLFSIFILVSGWRSQIGRFILLRFQGLDNWGKETLQQLKCIYE